MIADSLKYVLQKMRFVEGFWKNTVCNWRKADWSNVMNFVNQYEKILKFSEDKHDQLYEEFP